MKRGSKVWVCHDGKWARRVPGHIVATRQGHHVLIEFQHKDQIVRFWARKVPAVRYWRTNRYTYSAIAKRYSYFKGWADIALFRPKFHVYRRKNGKKFV
jgi:hypothetical protein